MNILAKLSLRYLVMNRKRTLVTVVAVMLAGALIFSVVSLAWSAKDLIEQDTIVNYGNFHVGVSDIPWSKARLIGAVDGVKNAMYSYTVGFHALENPQDDMKPYITLTALNDGAYQNLFFKLKEGRLPENSHEIILPEWLLIQEGLDWKVGDTIRLQLGWRVLLPKDYPVTPLESVPQEKIQIEKNPEAFIRPANREEIAVHTANSYTVVGITAFKKEDTNIQPGYAAYTFLDTSMLKDDDPVTAMILFTKKEEVGAGYVHVAETLGEPVITDRIVYNEVSVK